MGEKNTEYNISGDFVQGDKHEHHHEAPRSSLNSFGHALYYPYIHLTDEVWLKHAFLFWDKISRIVPHSFEPQDSEDIIRIKQETNFLEDYCPEKLIIRDTFRSFSESLEKYINDNLKYKNKVRRESQSKGKYELLLKEREFKTIQNGSYIHIEKMDSELIEKLSKLGLAIPGDNEWTGWIKIDNMVGQSYMTYLAKSISSEKSIPMVTDTEEFYSSQGVYQEGRYENRFKEELGYLLMDMVVPKEINNITMEQLIKLRTKYNDQRMAFFDEINKISTTLPSIDNQSTLQDALHYYNTLLSKKTKELEKVFNLNGITTIKKPLAISMCASFVTGSLWGTSAGLAYGAFSSYIEYERKKIERDSHPMSYLLNIKSELNKEDLFQKIQKWSNFERR